MINLSVVWLVVVSGIQAFHRLDSTTMRFKQLKYELTRLNLPFRIEGGKAKINYKSMIIQN
jgi:hypothetical protein